MTSRPAELLRRARPNVATAHRVLGLAAAGMLAVDAYVHASDAGFYDANTGALISQGTLFRVEAVVAALAAAALLVRPCRVGWLATLVVAASAAGAVLLYRYVDIGALGPLPDLYEPTWSSPSKLLSVYAEGLAVLLSLAGLLVHRRRA